MTVRCRISLVLLVALVSVAAGPAHGAGLPLPESDSGSPEREGGSSGGGSSGIFGLFGRAMLFDSDFYEQSAAGVGVRAGWSPVSDWALELDVSFNDTGQGTNNLIVPIHARLLKEWQMADDLGWHLGAGGAYYEFSDADGFGGPGFSFATGLQYTAGRATLLRMDFVADTIPNLDWYGIRPAVDGWQPPETDADWHFALEFGLQHASPDR